jgi:ubiquinol-cytochrome c reductase cytochrome c subunit
MRGAFALLMMLAGPAVGSVTPAAQTPAAPATATAPVPAPAGSAEKGRLTFARVGCSQCHGGEAQGSPTTGPRLGPAGIPYQSFARYVRAPRAQMPPYTDKILRDQDLADIYAFAQSRPKPATPALLQ